MASASAEQAVKKLARLPSNTVCPNCGTTKKFGFSTVCIKYLTFVCNNCKSSHQAISHRCKSLTMSSWTDGEVLQLKTHGNDHARATWLAKAPPIGANGRPKEGDPIDVFKRFILDAYEHKKYYSESGGGVAPAPVAAPVSRSSIPQAPRSAPVRIPRQAVAPPAPPPRAKTPPPPAPAVDLFSFDVAPTTVSAAAPTTSSAAHDPFAPVATPASGSVDVFAATATIPPAPASAPSFDLFANTTTTTTTTASAAAGAAKKPVVMSNNAGQSNLISNMNSMMPPPSGSGGQTSNTKNSISSFGFMNNGGMTGNTNMNPMQQQQMQMMMMQQQMQMMNMNQNNNTMGGGFGNTNPTMGGMGAFGGMNHMGGNNNHMGGFNSHQQGPHAASMNYMQSSHGSTISHNFGAGGGQAKRTTNRIPLPICFKRLMIL